MTIPETLAYAAGSLAYRALTSGTDNLLGNALDPQGLLASALIGINASVLRALPNIYQARSSSPRILPPAARILSHPVLSTLAATATWLFTLRYNRTTFQHLFALPGLDLTREDFARAGATILPVVLCTSMIARVLGRAPTPPTAIQTRAPSLKSLAAAVRPFLILKGLEYFLHIRNPQATSLLVFSILNSLAIHFFGSPFSSTLTIGSIYGAYVTRGQMNGNEWNDFFIMNGINQIPTIICNLWRAKT